MCDREKDALSSWIMSLCCDFHHLLLSLLLVLLFVRWAGKSRTVWKPKQLKDTLYVYWKAAFARWGEDCGRHCNRLNICVLFMSLYCPARLPLKAKQYCLAFNKCNYFIIAAVKALSDMDIISATQPNTHTHTPPQWPECIGTLSWWVMSSYKWGWDNWTMGVRGGGGRQMD